MCSKTISTRKKSVSDEIIVFQGRNLRNVEKKLQQWSMAANLLPDAQAKREPPL